jgi:hypothetical protein
MNIENEVDVSDTDAVRQRIKEIKETQPDALEPFLKTLSTNMLFDIYGRDIKSVDHLTQQEFEAIAIRKYHFKSVTAVAWLMGIFVGVNWRGAQSVMDSILETASDFDRFNILVSFVRAVNRFSSVSVGVCKPSYLSWLIGWISKYDINGDIFEAKDFIETVEAEYRKYALDSTVTVRELTDFVLSRIRIADKSKLYLEDSVLRWLSPYRIDNEKEFVALCELVVNIPVEAEPDIVEPSFFCRHWFPRILSRTNLTASDIIAFIDRCKIPRGLEKTLKFVNSMAQILCGFSHRKGFRQVAVALFTRIHQCFNDCCLDVLTTGEKEMLFCNFTQDIRPSSFDDYPAVEYSDVSEARCVLFVAELPKFGISNTPIDSAHPEWVVIRSAETNELVLDFLRWNAERIENKYLTAKIEEQLEKGMDDYKIVRV